MATSSASDFESLDAADQRRVNEACERFEEVLRQGQAARAEDFLDGATIDLRSLLLRELLLLECEYRFRRRDPPSLEEVASRMAGQLDLAGAILDSARNNALEQAPLLPPDSGALAAAWIEATGRFRIRRLLGQGGFGVVYLADAPELGGEVALKTPLPEMLRVAEARARFLREARAAAALDHPHIVRVLEVGEAGPVCYFASEYIPGPNLSEWLRAQQTGVPIRLAIAITHSLAEAIHAAHQAGVLHCDLKPANVLVGADAEPMPRVTDFGLAQLAGQSTMLTATGAILGTPMYMAPEQAAGRRLEVSPQTDVYALGAILYELLAGHPPFPPGPAAEVLHRVLYDEPVRLRISRPALPRDLEAICLRCLEKQVHRRYASAAELLEDLERVQQGKRTRARLPGLIRRCQDWARRKPATAVACVSALALLVVLLAGGTYHLHRLKRSNEELSRAMEERSILVDDLAQERNQLRSEEADLRRQLYPEAIRHAHELLDRNERHAFLQALAAWEPQGGKEDLRGFEWYYLKHGLDRGASGQLACGSSDIHSLAYAPDGKSFAVAGKDGRVRLCATAPMRVLAELPHPNEVGRVLYLADGNRLASACDDGVIRLWTPQGKLQGALPATHGKIRALAYSPESRILASAGDDQTIRLWSVEEPDRPPRVVDHRPWGPVKGLAFAERGTVLLAGELSHVLHFFRVSDGHCFAEQALGDFKVELLTVAAGDGVVAAAYPGGVVQVWDTGGQSSNPAAWRSLGTASGFQRVRCLSFSTDARMLLVCGERSVQVWSVRPFQLLHVVRGHEGRVWAGAFHPTGGQLLTGGTEGMARCWDLAALADSGAIEVCPRTIPRLAFLPDSMGLLMLAKCSAWIPLPLSATAQCDALPALEDFWAGVLPRAERTLISLDRVGRVDRWKLDPDSGRRFHEPSRLLTLPPLLEPGSESGFRAGAFSSDGHLLAVRDGTIISVWDLALRKQTATLVGHEREVTVLAFGPGDVLASGSYDASVRLWDIRTGQLKAICRGHTGGIRDLSFGRAGEELASSSNDQTVRIWNWRTGTERRALVGHHGVVQSVAYDPGGQTLASAGADGTVRLWQAASGRELLVLTPGRSLWISIAFSPDGRYLAAVRQPGFAEGCMVNVWDAGESRPLDGRQVGWTLP
jgi:WD40 repeat protein/serine/threonine protein kinase